MRELVKRIKPIQTGIVLLWLYALVSAIFRPLLNDNMVFYAWAQQVYDSTLSGVEAFESVWEIKGIFSRFIYYQLYWLTQFFSPTLFPYGQYVYQAFGYIEICLLIGLAMYLIPQKLLSKKEKIYGFLIITAAFFTSTPSAVLQPEEWGICVLLLSVAFILRGSMVDSIIGGVFLGSIFFLKTPLLLLSGSVFFGYMIVKRLNLIETIKAIWLYALSSLIFIVVILGFLYIFCPIEIQDIRDASHYQSTLLTYRSIIPILRDLGHSITKMWQLPVYIPIIMVGALSAMMYISQQSFKKIVAFITIWLFPFLYVVLSNCYFQYHFITFLFPAFASLYLIKDEIKFKSEEGILWGILLTIFLGVLCSLKECYYLIRLTGEYFFIIPYLLIGMGLHNRWKNKALFASTLFSIFIFISWNSIASYAHRDEITQIKECIQINANNHHYQHQVLGDGDSILTLDAGVSHLWMSNTSYLRYFYPLPLQRITDDSEFKTSKTYKSTKEKVMNYTGMYIVIDSAWYYGNAKQDDIKCYIESNYDKVDKIMDIANNGYTIYSKANTAMTPLYIYKRKE